MLNYNMTTKRKLYDDCPHVEYKWLPAIGPYCSTCGLAPTKKKISEHRDSPGLDAYEIDPINIDGIQDSFTDKSTPENNLSSISPYHCSIFITDDSGISENIFANSPPSKNVTVTADEIRPTNSENNVTVNRNPIRKIVRRMEENGLLQDSDFVEVADEALRRYDVLKLKSVTGSVSMTNFMHFLI